MQAQHITFITVSQSSSQPAIAISEHCSLQDHEQAVFQALGFY